MPANNRADTRPDSYIVTIVQLTGVWNLAYPVYTHTH